MAGRLAFVAERGGNTLTLMRSGFLRALPITDAARIGSATDIPTVSESGVGGYNAYTRHAVLARMGTPDVAVKGMIAADQCRAGDPSRCGTASWLRRGTDRQHDACLDECPPCRAGCEVAAGSG